MGSAGMSHGDRPEVPTRFLCVRARAFAVPGAVRVRTRPGGYQGGVRTHTGQLDSSLDSFSGCRMSEISTARLAPNFQR